MKEPWHADPPAAKGRLQGGLKQEAVGGLF